MEVTASSAIPSADALPAPCVPSDPASARSGEGGASRSEILARIIEHTQPAPLHPKWAFLGKLQWGRQLCVGVDELTASLLAEFSVEDLLAAHVLGPRSDNEFSLARVFGGPKAKFLVLRDASDVPLDAISSRGALESGSAAAPLRIGASRRRKFRGARRVLLAASDDDLLVLRGIGFECTSAAGLSRLSGQQIRELFANPAHGEQLAFRLTLPAWQIAEVVNATTPIIVDTLTRLADIPRVFGIDVAAVIDVWLPSTEEFQEILAARSYRDRRLLGTQEE